MSAESSGVFVGLASIPSRVGNLRAVVERLLPQVSQMGVYLNGYGDVPDFLRRDRIIVARSQQHGDVRDNGKFFFLDKSDERFYATVDDDILYPTDYVETLVSLLKETELRSAIGVHGALYPHPVIEAFDARIVIHFNEPLPHVTPVHLLGTGTTIIDQHDWQLRFSEFGTPGMADIWFAVAARRRGAHLFVVPRNRRWLQPIEASSGSQGGALFHEGLLHSDEQSSQLRQATTTAGGLEGLVASLLGSDHLGDRFSIRQALHLDMIRRQLGFAPLTEGSAGHTHALLRQQRSDWPKLYPLTSEATEAVIRLVVDVLADRVTASSVGPALETLGCLQDMAETEPSRWKILPHALRFDSRHDRLASLRKTLISRGMRGGTDDARQLWTQFRERTEISPAQALVAERASVHTRFERLPTFAHLARAKPRSAARLLYDYIEVNDGARGADITALRLAFGAAFENLDVQFLIGLAAIRSGDLGLASRTVDRLRQRWPWDVDVRLMGACLAGLDADAPADRLSPALRVLDEALVSQGLTPCRKLLQDDRAQRHWIQAFAVDQDSRPGDSHALPSVSVLMTTHNDAETVSAAMHSILGSTGVELELIVVDDASTDGTLDLVRAIKDPRIKIIVNSVNVGPYVSRNRGLTQAVGEHIAIADADDWSHPQRLKYQCSILETSPHVLACRVAHVRVQPSGQINLENHMRFVGDGPMSLMYRRWLTDHIGGFDHVRTRGDMEFMLRLTARFGPDALSFFGTPLVLATSSARSNSKLFQEESLDLYRSSFRKWHERHAGSDALYIPLSGSRGPFLAPYELLVDETTGAN